MIIAFMSVAILVFLSYVDKVEDEQVDTLIAIVKTWLLVGLCFGAIEAIFLLTKILATLKILTF